MQLLTITLENFQGIKAAEYKFDGKNAAIYGDNATGKTTVFNAYTWLLFAKPSNGAKGFTPKTKGKDGDLHNLEHAAEAKFRANDDRIITLRKAYSEVYKKRRGSSVKEFDGHTTEFYIDGVPVKEKEYQDYLDTNFGPADQLKMLTMPMFFAEDMDWQARRQILLDVCGDVTDDDVIASTADLKDLPDYLRMNGSDQQYTVDDYRLIAGAQKKKINHDLEAIPSRIDEAQRAIPDLSGINAEAIAAKIGDLKAKRYEAETAKVNASAGDTNAAEIRQRIAEIKAQTAEAQAAHIAVEIAKNEEARKSIAEIKDMLGEELTARDDLEREILRLRKNVAAIERDREELLAEYKSKQAEQWGEDAEICPACGQALPTDKVEKLRTDFNRRKSETLQKLNERGQSECSKDVIAAIESKIAEHQATMYYTVNHLKQIEHDLSVAESQVIDEIPFESTRKFAELDDALKECRYQESHQSEAIHDALKKHQAEIDSINMEIAAAEETAAQIKLVELQTVRVGELEKQEKRLASEYELIERGLFLCDLFIKTKVGMLTDRINAKFQSVSFRLFVDQINGGVKEDCEVLVPGEGGRLVPYRDANNAARINAGLEIIKVLSEHWDVSMPVFVDNAESVTRLADIGGQIIRLIVSENDKKLRLEYEK